MNDELRHDWLKKGQEAPNHKYIMRIPVGKGYRYIYSMAEARALKDKSASRAAPKAPEIKAPLQKTAQRLTSSVQSTVKSAVNSASATYQQAKATAQTTANKFVSNQTVQNAVTTVENAVKKVVPDQEAKKSDDAVENGKNAVKKAIDKEKDGMLFVVTPGMIKTAVKLVSSLIDSIPAVKQKKEEEAKRKAEEIKRKAVEEEARRSATTTSNTLPGYENLQKEVAQLPESKRQDTLVQFYQDSEPEFMKNVPEKDPPDMLSADDQAEINELYPEDGHTSNCGYCTAAYELRRRGYDVEANTDDVGTDTFILGSWYENAHYETVYLPTVYNINVRDAQKELSMYAREYDATVNVEAPSAVSRSAARREYNEMILVKMSVPNSRGDLRVQWLGSGGHSMAYETDSHGNVTVIDCQTNTRYSGKEIEEILEYTCMANVIRTDNLQLKKGILEAVHAN